MKATCQSGIVNHISLSGRDPSQSLANQFKFALLCHSDIVKNQSSKQMKFDIKILINILSSSFPRFSSTVFKPIYALPQWYLSPCNSKNTLKWAESCDLAKAGDCLWRTESTADG